MFRSARMGISKYTFIFSSSALISICCLNSYSLENSSNKERVKNERALEEVLVQNDKDKPTEMNIETEMLTGIAGAADDPLQAIYALPGVTFSSDGGPGGSEPVIRGSAPQDNAYFIDLVPASYIFHIFGNSIFNKYLIRSFDLYPAAYPSKYGNATGGIIDVTLREPRFQDFTTTLHSSIISVGALLESGLGNDQAFYLSYRRSTLDQLLSEEDLADDEVGLQIDRLPIFDDYQFKYHWSVNENNSLSVIAAGASDTVAATFSEGNELVERDPDFAGPAEINQGFDSQGIIWNWEQGSRKLTSILTHISEEEDFTYGRNQHETTNTDRYLARFIYSQKISNAHQLKSGISVEDINYDVDFNAKIPACTELEPECSTVDTEYVTYKDSLKVSAYEFFLQDEWRVNSKNLLTFGLHYGEDDYLSEGRIEPRMRWDYQINERFSTYVSAGQYSQLPLLREMIDVLGNPELTTVKSDHYVWGFNQKLNNGWSWNTDLYYKDMSDIVISSGQDDDADNYSNNAEGAAYGIEFLIKKELTDRWYGWVSLSLSETDRTNITTGETVKFEYDKPVIFNLVANRLLGQHWMLGFKWNYQSGGRYTPVVDLEPSRTQPSVLEPVYGELNSQRYPAYHKLDFRAEYTKPKDWGYWKFYVDILNVYNRENVEEYEYSPNGEELIDPPAGYGEDIPVTQETSDGLFPSIGVEIQF